MEPEGGEGGLWLDSKKESLKWKGGGCFGSLVADKL